MGWDQHGVRTSYGYPDVLRFRDNQVFNLRTLSDELPLPVWYHQCRDASGNFIKVRCTRAKGGGGCKLCEANNTPEFAKAQNADRPYPLKLDYVGLVWVVQESRVMLLAGKQVWDRIAEFGKEYQTLADTELKITRTNTSGNREYSVVPKRPQPALQVAQGTPVPSIEAYLKWLEDNVNRVASLDAVIKRGVGASAPVAPAAPAFSPAPTGTYVPAPAAPAQPFQPAAMPPAPAFQPMGAQVSQPAGVTAINQPAPVAPAAGWGQGLQAPPQPQAPAPVVSSNEEAARGERARFMALTKVWFEPVYVEQLMNKYAPGVPMEHKPLDQLQAMNSEYLQKIVSFGPDAVQKLKAAGLVQ